MFGADPCLVDGQTCRWRSHKVGGRLPLFFAWPVVTFQAAEHRRRLAVPNYTSCWQNMELTWENVQTIRSIERFLRTKAELLVRRRCSKHERLCGIGFNLQQQRSVGQTGKSDTSLTFDAVSSSRCVRWWMFAVCADNEWNTSDTLTVKKTEAVFVCSRSEYTQLGRGLHVRYGTHLFTLLSICQ